jgi:hypothetical protein
LAGIFFSSEKRNFLNHVPGCGKTRLWTGLCPEFPVKHFCFFVVFPVHPGNYNSFFNHVFFILVVVKMHLSPVGGTAEWSSAIYLRLREPKDTCAALRST